MDDKLSLIIPIYNVEPYLYQCLDSVINQTYRNLEIILIDDGSPDNCGVICDEYAERDERVKVIHKKNGGLSAARNDGLDIATGDWIAFIDSDDWCDADYFEEMMQAAEFRSCDIIWSGGYYEEHTGRMRIHRTLEEAFVTDEKQEIVELTAKSILCGPPWDKLFRRKLIQESHLRYDTSFKANEDVWFNFIAHSVAHKIGGINRIGYHFRINPISITHGYNPEKPKYCYHTIECFRAYAELRGMDRKILEAIRGRSIIQIIASLNCCYFHPAHVESYKVIAKEINQMKKWTYYDEAIFSKGKNGLKGKIVLFKYVLRLPWIWPVYLLYCANQQYKKVLPTAVPVVQNAENTRGGVTANHKYSLGSFRFAYASCSLAVAM